MIKEGHFGFYEAFSLMTIVLITKIFFASPMVIIKTLGTAAWLGTLVSCATSIVFFFILYSLMKRFPQQDLYQIFESVTGKMVGKSLIIIFGIFLLYSAAVNLREFITVLKIYSMPFTPPGVLIFAFLLVVTALAYVGLEGIARTAFVFFYPVIGSLFLIIILSIPSYDFDYLKPYFGYGLMHTLFIGTLRSSAYDEIVFLAVIIRSIHGLKLFKKAGFSSLLLTGIVFSTCLACIVAAFQYTVGSEHVSGMYQLTRIIYFSRFFQRIEAIFLFIWVITSIITVSFTFYLALSSYCRAFEINNHRPLLLPFSILTFVLALYPSTLAEIIEVHIMILREFSSVILMLIPVMVFILAVVRGKKGVMRNANTN
ncbi:MAG: endospore germination permease [Peptococcaceae bacterium]|nr:endospore germination permease [Peptococcaceae bacterium]